MSWKDFVCLSVVLVGVVLFLYGANYFNTAVGWTGVYAMIGGLVGEIVLKVYENITKGERGQKP